MSECYRIDASAGELTRILGHDERVVSAGHGRESRRYYDTFDWRLAHHGLRLASVEREGRRGLELQGLAAGPIFAPGMEPDPVRPLPQDAGSQALVQGALSRAVAPLAGIRALLPQVEVTRRVHEWRVLDREDKTVVRLELGDGSVRDLAAGGARPAFARRAPQPLAGTLVLRGVRGYERELERVRASLAETLCGAGDLLDLALSCVGRERARESGPPQPHIEAAQPAGVALARLLAALAQVVRANVEGARLDLDSEFLHDLRVALRRTRSALAQLKDVLPAARVEPFREELRWLGTVTGPVRDLDVFLLGFEDLRAEVSPAARADLEPLRAHLLARRGVERKVLERALRSARLRRLLEGWEALLAEIAEGRIEHGADAPRADWPVARVAADRLRRSARRLRKQGRAIDADTPASELHALRIQGKKLRYLLELFRGLFEPSDFEPQHAALKKLQTVLGDFNDCSVQEAALAHFADQMLAAGAAPAATLLAMGRLAERIALRAERERERFAELFAAFDAPDLRKAFGAMLNALQEESAR